MMHYSIVILALATSVSANIYIRQDIPACASDCLTKGLASAGGCSPTDTKCLCQNQSFISGTTSCITGACKGDDLKNAAAAAEQLCASVGVTLTSTVAGETGATTTATSSGALSTASSASPVGSSGTSKASSTVSSATPSVASSASSTATSKSSGAAISSSVNVFAGAAAVGLAALL